MTPAQTAPFSSAPVLTAQPLASPGRPQAADAAARLAAVGAAVSRYGVAALLLVFGLFKFTPTEAAGIAPLVQHSPLMSWLPGLLGQQGTSNFIGSFEVLTALLMALRPWSARLSALGSALAGVIFLSTLTFLFSTPGVWKTIDGFLLPVGNGGDFIVKDLVLFGASLWTAGEAWLAARARS